MAQVCPFSRLLEYMSSIKYEEIFFFVGKAIRVEFKVTSLTDLKLFNDKFFTRDFGVGRLFSDTEPEVTKLHCRFLALLLHRQ